MSETFRILPGRERANFASRLEANGAPDYVASLVASAIFGRDPVPFKTADETLEALRKTISVEEPKHGVTHTVRHGVCDVCDGESTTASPRTEALNEELEFWRNDGRCLTEALRQENWQPCQFCGTVFNAADAQESKCHSVETLRQEEEQAEDAAYKYMEREWSWCDDLGGLSFKHAALVKIYADGFRAGKARRPEVTRELARVYNVAYYNKRQEINDDMAACLAGLEAVFDLVYGAAGDGNG
jgi:hypothetical protein